MSICIQTRQHITSHSDLIWWTVRWHPLIKMRILSKATSCTLLSRRSRIQLGLTMPKLATYLLVKVIVATLLTFQLSGATSTTLNWAYRVLLSGKMTCQLFGSKATIRQGFNMIDKSMWLSWPEAQIFQTWIPSTKKYGHWLSQSKTCVLVTHSRSYPVLLQTILTTSVRIQMNPALFTTLSRRKFTKLSRLTGLQLCLIVL